MRCMFDTDGNLLGRGGIVHPKSYVEERFWPKTERRIGECWTWTGNIGARGYGFFALHHEKYLAHRVAYGLTYGTVPHPHELELDHLCRNHGCVNPTHLEAVTAKENQRRGMTIAMLKAKVAARTHCRNGHPWSEDNTGLRPSRRFCRACKRAGNAACKARVRAARRKAG